MKSFVGKVAAITGAASGIGRSLAIDLARRGCHVALCDINEQGLAETAETAKPHSVRVTHARVDVAERAAMYAWAAQVVGDHGKVNMIFNNAGVSVAGTVEGVDYPDLEWVMNTNFWGVVHGTKAFLPLLRASGDGHVINISSMFGLMASIGRSFYCASKFAVRGFTEALCQELVLEGAPIGVTCVLPGGVRSSITRSGRYTESIRNITGLTPEQARKQFEKLLLTPPEEAARVILDGVARNKRRVLIGSDVRRYDLIQRLLPSGYHDVMLRAMRRRAKRKKSTG